MRSFPSPYLFFFFFNDTATTEIYTLSLHDALPIAQGLLQIQGLLYGTDGRERVDGGGGIVRLGEDVRDRELIAPHLVIRHPEAEELAHRRLHSRGRGRGGARIRGQGDRPRPERLI